MCRLILILLVGASLNLPIGASAASISANVLADIKSGCQMCSSSGPARILKCVKDRSAEYAVTAANYEDNKQVPTKVLPDGTPEEQYSFALGKAMSNDLEAAEAAFIEFLELHQRHKRTSDALFWLGRVQYALKKYERATITFSEFSRMYPGDTRMPDTTLLIAESVSKFAPPKQACAIYRELPNLVEAPTDQFIAKLAALSEAASCGN